MRRRSIQPGRTRSHLPPNTGSGCVIKTPVLAVRELPPTGTSVAPIRTGRRYQLTTVTPHNTSSRPDPGAWCFVVAWKMRKGGGDSSFRFCSLPDGPRGSPTWSQGTEAALRSPSRPIPDCLKPPNAIVKSVRNALWPTVPERSCRATSWARSTSLVNTEAFNP